MNRFFNQIALVSATVLASFNPIDAQTIATFEELNLPTNSYWNGSDMPAGANFTSGNALFPNYYAPSFGGYWQSGWAYSNLKDSTTAGFGNLYAARPASGCNNSNTYIVGQQGSVLHLTGAAAGKVVSGVYLTNGTYPAISMRDGDTFAKKFGGVSGADPDYFKLVVRKYLDGAMGTDSVTFFLADFRFANNAADYIVQDWRWLDLSSLGNADSLVFNLASSDVGEFGINTPTFFCMDNFTTSDIALSTNIIDNQLTVTLFPNPAHDIVQLANKGIQLENTQIQVIDANGRVVFSIKNVTSMPTIPIQHLDAGMYFVVIQGDEFRAVKSFIKE